MYKKKKKNMQKLFKWKHFVGEIILWLVRWYGRYALSYRDLKEIAAERGLSVERSTIMRWVHEYSPELEKRIKPHLKMSCSSTRIDETYVKIKGIWHYLYRAVDKDGQTLDWMLSVKRNKKAANSVCEVQQQRPTLTLLRTSNPLARAKVAQGLRLVK